MRIIVKLFLGCLVLLSLAGCAGSGRPYWAIKPVYDVRNSPIPVPDPRMKPPVPRRAVASAPAGNPSRQPAKPAQAVTKAVTGPQVTVQRGDTVYGIATRHGLPVRDVISANGLRAPYRLAVGQTLALPSARFHEVRKGETSYSISRRYGVDLKSLVAINRLRPPYTLAVGQKLQLPGGARQRVAAVASRAQRTAISAPPPRSGVGFVWPVSGRVVSSFGSKGGGLHNDGINIRADRGTPVRAADDGVVAFAGDGLRGYGNLLLIRHANGWVTAYAHNATLLVERGDRVRQGQTIARVGATGGVTEPQLHFEIRRGTQAVDPTRYLRTRQAVAN